ncbi:MAG: CoA pyrophosphatase [Polyangiaceae bacterium]|nr:CoA pyrophosphatase [Polyangiaceae bacterium]MCW5791861.1 CoA pyrophosphatase [Polyangiaceae bacterium]
MHRTHRTSLPQIRAALEARSALPVEPGSEPQAAVATILRPASDPSESEVLLIRRAVHERDPWSGHMAFPGGRRDPGDASLLATAVRETEEELDLKLLERGQVLGQLDSIPAMAKGRPVGLSITPFVFELYETPRLSPNHEVAEAIWAPLGPLITGARATTTRYVYPGGALELPAFDVDGRVVWGLTYQMLQRLFELLRAP